MTLTIIRDGVEVDLKEFVRVREFLVEPLTIQYDEYKVDQGDVLIVPRGYNTRRIKATLRMSGITMSVYALKLAELRALFTHTDPFYLLDSHDSKKMWYVRNDGGFSVTRTSKHATIEVSFVCINKYGISRALDNLVPRLWSANKLSWGDNISWSGSYPRTFEQSNEFEYNYLGTANLDPRENPLTIIVNGTFNENVVLENLTTGDTFIYNGKLTDSEMLFIEGTTVRKNQTHVRDNTNYSIITLKPGINRFRINGNPESVELKHRNYFL